VLLAARACCCGAVHWLQTAAPCRARLCEPLGAVVASSRAGAVTDLLPPMCLSVRSTAQKPRPRRWLAACKTLAITERTDCRSRGRREASKASPRNPQRPDRSPDTRGPLEKPFQLGSLAPKRNRVTTPRCQQKTTSAERQPPRHPPTAIGQPAARAQQDNVRPAEGPPAAHANTFSM
jgi:hypothetical protein